MKLLWTKRGLKRLQSAFDYIADNFYLDYAIQFDNDARNVALMFPANPQLGREAFPELDRPEIRKFLCDHYNYWIYYRVQKSVIEILSVRHTLMNIRSPKQL